MKLTEETSRHFRTMGIICAFLVVCMHIWPEPSSGSAGWFLRRLTCEGISVCAVPFFFLTAGYFVAGRMWGDKGWYRTEIF